MIDSWKKYQKQWENSNMTITDMMKSVVRSSMNPRKSLQNILNVRYKDAEMALIRAALNDTIDFEFFVTMVKVLLLENTSENCLLKSLFLKTIIDWRKTKGMKFGNSLIVAKGSQFWKKGARCLIAEDLLELSLQPYTTICWNASVKRAHIHGNDWSAMSVARDCLSHYLFKYAAEKMVHLQVLRLEFLQLDDSKKVEESKISGECCKTRHEIAKLLERLRAFENVMDSETKIKCKFINFYTEPNLKSLKVCIEAAKVHSGNFSNLNSEMKIALLSAVLKYHLMFTNDYETCYKWLSKMKLPDVTKHKITSFQFISLLNVYEAVSMDSLPALNEYVSNYNVSSKDDNKLPKVNIQLLGLLAHMRVYLGETAESDEMILLSSKVKSYLVNGLLKDMEELYQL